jgi:hypothetical protein
MSKGPLSDPNPTTDDSNPRGAGEGTAVEHASNQSDEREFRGDNLSDLSLTS